MLDLPTVLAGFGFGLSLIVAIGAQNAFVLRQGLRGEHVLLVVLTCALSDAVLIVAGVAGAGAVLEEAPGLESVVRVAGAAFLLGYAVLAARRAWRPSALTADAGGPGAGRAATFGAVMALTWLNPHVYLDTIVLLGSVADAHGDGRWAFGAGAILGSATWFTVLGRGAALLRPVFARPGAWRLLDAAVAVIMVAIAAMLLTGA
ncbi:LysE/ArgO family amino acid transporter [Patulibacter sp.]|uniref:LysE/ArgO family amino acid transporter n=1 Tax=Patulibacter sp. TaxID=1912859 RepID=UPI002726A0AA|nr:LysE/ArgO family amino acid transporter [Patulibacter sp.]MDO9408368.1 LysE/ArgO family amino acid transporter [Patulibacter sp.]